MKITKSEIKTFRPCFGAWKWYLKNQEEDLLTLLLNVNSDKTAVDEDGSFQGAAWANWLMQKLVEGKKELAVKIAVYSARLVLGIYEYAYPDNRSPREAIEAAEKWLENPCKETSDAVWAAADASWAAARAARAAEGVWAVRAVMSAGPTWAARAAAEAAYTARAAEGVWAARAARTVEDAAEAAEDVWADKAVEAANSFWAARKEFQEKIIREFIRLLE